MTRIAAFIGAGRDLGAAVERVQLAESLGYESVFTSQVGGRDGLMLLSAYANATTTIKLGTGVLPALPRHPVALAIEAATLDEISGGRLILGVGPSHKITMEGWYGLSIDRAFSKMREYVTILRQVFTTGGSTFSGEFYNTQFGFLGYAARKDLPIFLSALAPNMLRFAGEACEGTILWGCLPSFIRSDVTPAITAAASAAGRPSPEIIAAIPTALTTDREAAFNALRKDFFVYMTLPFYRRAIAGAGYQAEIDAFDKANANSDFPGALTAMSDKMMDAFAAVGDTQAIKSKYDEYRDAGVTLTATGLFDAGEGFAGFDETLRAVAS